MSTKKTQELFARLQAIYGSRWTSCYSDNDAVLLAIAEWAEIVERMSDEQLVRAVSWAKTMSPWPPSIAEFLHAGLGIDELVVRNTTLVLLPSWDRSHMTSRDMEAFVKRNREQITRRLVKEGLRPVIQITLLPPHTECVGGKA